MRHGSFCIYADVDKRNVIILNTFESLDGNEEYSLFIINNLVIKQMTTEKTIMKK